MAIVSVGGGAGFFATGFFAGGFATGFPAGFAGAFAAAGDADFPELRAPVSRDVSGET